MTVDIVDGLNALIKNTEGRLYDHERKFLETAVLHIQGIRAVAGKASGEGSFRDISEGIPRHIVEPLNSGGYNPYPVNTLVTSKDGGFVKMTPEEFAAANTGDGIALTSIAHPEGPAVADDVDINPDSLVTIERETSNEAH